MSRRRRQVSTGEARAMMADHARDAKKEQAMCAHGGCTTSHDLREGPNGWSGHYGGTMLCEDCYENIVNGAEGNQWE